MEEKEIKDILVKFLKDIEEEIYVTNFDEVLEAIETVLQSLENKDKEIKELKEELQEYKDSNRILKTTTYMKILNVNSEIEEFWDNIPKRSTKAIIRLHLLHRVKELLNELQGE